MICASSDQSCQCRVSSAPSACGRFLVSLTPDGVIKVVPRSMERSHSKIKADFCTGVKFWNFWKAAQRWCATWRCSPAPGRGCAGMARGGDGPSRAALPCPHLNYLTMPVKLRAPFATLYPLDFPNGGWSGAKFCKAAPYLKTTFFFEHCRRETSCLAISLCIYGSALATRAGIALLSTAQGCWPSRGSPLLWGPPLCCPVAGVRQPLPLGPVPPAAPGAAALTCSCAAPGWKLPSAAVWCQQLFLVLARSLECCLHCKFSPCLVLCAAMSRVTWIGLGYSGEGRLLSSRPWTVNKIFFALAAGSGWILSKPEMRNKGNSIPVFWKDRVIFCQPEERIDCIVSPFLWLLSCLCQGQFLSGSDFNTLPHAIL